MESGDETGGSVDSFDSFGGGAAAAAPSRSRGSEVNNHIVTLTDLLQDHTRTASTRLTKALAVFESIKRIVSDNTHPAADIVDFEQDADSPYRNLWDRIISSTITFTNEMVGLLPNLSQTVRSKLEKSGGPLKDMVIILKIHEDEEGAPLLPKGRVVKLLGCCHDVLNAQQGAPPPGVLLRNVNQVLLTLLKHPLYAEYVGSSVSSRLLRQYTNVMVLLGWEDVAKEHVAVLVYLLRHYERFSPLQDRECLKACVSAMRELAAVAKRSKRGNDFREIWTELTPGINTCCTMLLQADYKAFVTFTNNLTDVMLSVWRTLWTLPKAALQNSNGLVHEVLLFFILVCAVRPESTEPESVSADEAIQRCVAEDRKRCDVHMVMASPEFASSRALLFTVMALDAAVSKDMARQSSEDRAPMGGGKRRRVDHESITAWDRVCSWLDGNPADVSNTLGIISVLVDPCRELRDVAVRLNSVPCPSADVFSQILKKVVNIYTDARKPDLALSCLGALEALMTLGSRSVTTLTLRWNEWDAVIDKISSTLEHSSSAVLQRGLRSLLHFFAQPPMKSSPAAEATLKLLAKIRSSTITCHLALVCLVNSSYHFSDRSRVHVVRSAFDYDRRDAPCPAGSWARAKLVLVAVQRRVNIDTDNVFLRPARDAVALRLQSYSVLDNPAPTSKLDLLCEHLRILSVPDMVASVAENQTCTDQEHVRRARMEVCGDGQGGDGVQNAQQLLRLSQVNVVVLEQLVDVMAQCADNLLDMDMPEEWRTKCILHQKMAFHVAVCLKMRFNTDNEIGEDHTVSLQLQHLDEKVLKLLGLVKDFLQSCVHEWRKKKTAIHSKTDFAALAALLETVCEIVWLDHSERFCMRLPHKPWQCANLRAPHSPSTSQAPEKMYQAYLAKCDPLFGDMECLARVIVDTSGLQQTVLDLAPPERVLSSPSFDPRHDYDRILLACVNFLHSWREISAWREDTAPDDTHWTTPVIRHTLGDSHEGHLPPWCVVLATCVSVGIASQRDPNLANSGLDYLLDEIREDDFFNALHPHTVNDILQALSYLVGAITAAPDGKQGFERLDKLCKEKKFLQSEVRRVRCSASFHMSMQSKYRRKLHENLQKRFLDERCLVTEIHLLQLLPSVLGTLAPPERSTFVANLVREHEERLREPTKKAKLKVYDPHKAVSLGVIIAVSTIYHEHCADALKASVKLNFTSTRMKTLTVALCGRLAGATHYTSGFKMACNFLPILYPEWLHGKEKKEVEEMVMSDKAALDALHDFPAFLFVKDDANINKLLASEAGMLLPAMSIEAVKMGGGVMDMFQNIFGRGHFEYTVPKIYAQFSLVLNTREVKHLRKVIGALHKTQFAACVSEIVRCAYSGTMLPTGTGRSFALMPIERVGCAVDNIRKILGFRHDSAADELLRQNCALDVLLHLAEDLDENRHRATFTKVFDAFRWILIDFFDIAHRIQNESAPHVAVLFSVRTICRILQGGEAAALGLLDSILNVPRAEKKKVFVEKAGVRVLAEAMNLLQSIRKTVPGASILLVNLRNKFTDVLSEHVTDCMRRAFPDLDSLGLFYGRRDLQKLTQEEASISATITRLWRFIIGIDTVSSLPGAVEIQCLRVYASRHGVALKSFVWDLTRTHVFYRMHELGASLDTTTDAAAALRYLGNLGAFELTAVRRHARSLPNPPTLLENIGSNRAGLEWRSNQLLFLMHECLGDRSIHTVKAAVSSLRQLMACHDPEIDKAADAMAAMLQPFQDSNERSPTRVAEGFDQRLWYNFNGGYEKWLARVVHGLLLYKDSTNGVLWATAPLCAASPQIAKFVLPHALYDILVDNPDANSFHREEFSKGINDFFSRCLSCPEDVPLSCVQCVTDALNVLRTFDRSAGRAFKRSAASAKAHAWLKTDHLLIAKVAARYSLHHTAVYYTELSWCSTKTSGHANARDIDDCQWSSIPEYLEAISNTGDPDSIYGSNTAVDAGSLVRTFEHERKWGKALELYEAIGLGSPAASAPRPHESDGLREVGLSRALFSAGLESLRSCFTLSCDVASFSPQHQSQITDLQYEAAWRQSVWGRQPVVLAVGDTSRSQEAPHSTIWRVLQRLHDHDYAGCVAAIQAGQNSAWNSLRAYTGENASSLNSVLALTHFLCEARDTVHIAEMMIAAADTSWADVAKSLSSMVVSWKDRLDTSRSSVDGGSLVRCGRAALLGILMDHAVSASPEMRSCALPRITQLRVACLKALGNHARESGKDNDCAAAIRGLEAVAASSAEGTEWKAFGHIERAKTLWFQGEERVALRLARTLSSLPTSTPEAKALVGEWSIATKSESPVVIVEKFLGPAVEEYSTLASTVYSAETVIASRLTLAHFADQQYKVSQKTLRETQMMLTNTCAELHSFTSKWPSMKAAPAAVRKRVAQLKNRRKWEEQELERIREEWLFFLQTAAESYMYILGNSDIHDVQIFRVCNLWFSNPDTDTVKQELKRTVLPTHKWLPLIYQLAAKLGVAAEGSDGSVGEELTDIVRKCVEEHPHHTLFVLIALKNGRDSGKNRAGKDGPGSLIAAVEKLLYDVRRKSPFLASLVEQMEKLSLQYIELANLDVRKSKEDPDLCKKLAGKFSLAKVKNLHQVAVVTRSTPVDPSGQYRNLVGIMSFDSQFSLAGGINMPKIISCHGTDGRRYKQVVKGSDDVRQDAVMQQVFKLANAWLRHDKHAQQRNLHVCTYKIIPLAPQSGVLEWCSGTVPLSQYLVRGDRAAHHRIFPNKLTNKMCRTVMARVADKPIEEKLKSFRNICQGFPPVMRYFFLEHFHSPAEWFERRLAYTRSVSTGAIVGYILGLGDRHPSNLLINTSTAELVHIDLGVSFDQGKELPTPETIPFRLTRDIVDGMGVGGVDGVFRICSEQTMRVLRQSQVSLLTILEVFLHDPLYTWKLTDAKVGRIMHEDLDDAPLAEADMGSDPGERASSAASPPGPDARNLAEGRNEEAERVLMQVRRKLEGKDGHASQLSVAGHVNALIREARDDRNLCRVFAGWHPWV